MTQIAETIRQQLITANKCAVMSWGTHHFILEKTHCDLKCRPEDIEAG